MDENENENEILVVGDVFFDEEGDELRVEAITGGGSDLGEYIVLAEDGLRYQLVWSGEGWEGELCVEEGEEL